MNTSEAAEALGTDPRTFRQFLRSPMSTHVAVGSGARYSFDERDLPLLRRKYDEWSATGKKARPASTTPAAPPVAREVSDSEKQRVRDQEVWTEEGEVTLPNIRDSRVLARVRRSAAEREERLQLLLMAAGLHVSQAGRS